MQFQFAMVDAISPPSSLLNPHLAQVAPLFPSPRDEVHHSLCIFFFETDKSLSLS